MFRTAHKEEKLVIDGCLSSWEEVVPHPVSAGFNVLSCFPDGSSSNGACPG